MNQSQTQKKKVTWDWTPIFLTLITNEEEPQQQVNLSPNVVLRHPEAQNPPQLLISIDIEKSLQFSSEQGYYWHKSWNLPNITVKLEVHDINTRKQLKLPNNLYCKIYAVKTYINHITNQLQLIDVGLRGTTCYSISTGRAFFNAIKFQSTSFNNEGVKFYLLLSIYIKNGDEKLIICTNVSPGIYVDSRKNNKDIHFKRISMFCDIFPIEAMEKEFQKRETKKKFDNQVVVRDDFDGLFNYLTAPNIRHKVKHPLFLLMKFNKCIQLYCTKNIKSTPFQLLEIQNTLNQEYQIEQSLAVEKVILIIHINAKDANPTKMKKVLEQLDTMMINSIKVVESLSEFDVNQFSLLDNLDDLRIQYLTHFDQISHSNSEAKQLFRAKYFNDPNLSEGQQSSEENDIIDKSDKMMEEQINHFNMGREKYHNDQHENHFTQNQTQTSVVQSNPVTQPTAPIGPTQDINQVLAQIQAKNQQMIEQMNQNLQILYQQQIQQQQIMQIQMMNPLGQISPLITQQPIIPLQIQQMQAQAIQQFQQQQQQMALILLQRGQVKNEPL